jgi:aminopeptidase
VPAKYDATSNDVWKKLIEIPTVEIVVWGQEHPEQLKDVAPERLTAVGKTFEVVGKTRVARSVRWIFLGNGLYPTEALAKRFGVTKDELAKIFWDGLAADLKTVRANGEAVRAILAKGKELRVKNPNGTDLKMKIEGRPTFANDGAVSDEDLKRGGGALQKMLPAGEVYFAPVAGTAEGKLVVDYYPYFEGAIEGLTLAVKAGKVTAMSVAKPSPLFDRFKKQYDASPERKDEISFVDIGINPDVKFPKTARPAVWVPAGMITIAVGDNQLAGGDNTCPFAPNWFLPGSTVTVDGKVIIEKGELKLPAAKK